MSNRRPQSSPAARSFALGVIVLGSVLLACACSRVRSSTETGNPPVIDVTRVGLEQRNGQVHVVGSAGAVTPAGSDIWVDNLRLETTRTGTSEDDGSFDVQTPGRLDDEYALQVRWGTQRSKLVRLTEGGAMTTDASVSELDASLPGDSGALGDAGLFDVCESLAHTIFASQRNTYDAADRTCVASDDCEAMFAPRCEALTHVCDEELGLSAAGADALSQEIARPWQAECNRLDELACSFPVVACLDPGPRRLACIAGRCELAAVCEGCAPECQLPFEPGTMGPSTRAFFHDPLSGACLGRSFNDGNNGNRFATLQACEAACPAPSQCPSGRLMREKCLECGPVGDCADQRQVCAKRCEAVAQCEGDPLGDAVCDEGTCSDQLVCF